MLIIENNINFEKYLYYTDLFDGIIFERIGCINDNKVIEKYYKNYPKFKESQDRFVQEHIMEPQSLGLFGSVNYYSAPPEENIFDLISSNKFFTIYNPSPSLHFLKEGLEKICNYCIKNGLTSILIYLEKRPEIINGAGFALFDKLSNDYPQLEITIRLFSETEI